MDKEFIKTLQQKAQELARQLESVKTTIALFNHENGIEVEEEKEEKPEKGIKIPQAYDENMTWNEKFFFGLSKTPSGFISDIVKELVKYSQTDAETLTKRISNCASILKKKKIIGGKNIGQKVKYFIK